MKATKKQKKALRRSRTRAKCSPFDRRSKADVAQYAATYPHLYSALARA